MRARPMVFLPLLALILAGCTAVPTPTAADAPSGSPEEPLTAAIEASAAPQYSEIGAGLSGSSAAPSAGESGKSVNSGQAWADSKIDMWKENSGIKSTKGFLYPYNLMTSWESPEPGIINIFLDNSMEFNRDGMQEHYQGPEDELRTMGLIMFESVGEASPELETVTFATEDGKHSGTYSRARTGADPNDRKAWAKEKYAQWIDGMNDVYESLCGAEITSLEVYRNCLPADPHAYVEKVESPAFGELVVTLADGPWIDGEYDMPASSFVSGNMMLKINGKAAIGEKVEKLTVIARDGEDTAVAHREDWEM